MIIELAFQNFDSFFKSLVFPPKQIKKTPGRVRSQRKENERYDPQPRTNRTRTESAQLPKRNQIPPRSKIPPKKTSRGRGTHENHRGKMRPAFARTPKQTARNADSARRNLAIRIHENHAKIEIKHRLLDRPDEHRLGRRFGKLIAERTDRVLPGLAVAIREGDFGNSVGKEGVARLLREVRRAGVDEPEFERQFGGRIEGERHGERADGGENRSFNVEAVCSREAVEEQDAAGVEG